MAKWFGKSKPVGAEDWIGFLDEGVKLEGTLQLSGAFRIDGEFKGTVRSQDRLILGETAQVEGDIEGTVVSVAGRISGHIQGTDRVEILPSGVVDGEVNTPCLVIEAGGVLEGRSHMRNGKEPATFRRPLDLAAQAAGSDD